MRIVVQRTRQREKLLFDSAAHLLQLTRLNLLDGGERFQFGFLSCDLHRFVDYRERARLAFVGRPPARMP